MFKRLCTKLLLLSFSVIALFSIIALQSFTAGQSFPRHMQASSSKLKHKEQSSVSTNITTDSENHIPLNSVKELAPAQLLVTEPVGDLLVKHSEGENVVLVLASNGGGNQADIDGLLEKVIEDRTSYAKKHGYGFFFTNTNRYNTGDMHPTWLKTNAISEAMTLFPNASWFWWLDQDAIIMTSDFSIETELLNSKSLTEKLLLHEKYIRKDLPEVFTPESYDMEEVSLIFSQDHNGLNGGSLIFRRSQWTDVLLDLWSNPDLAKATGFGKEQDLIRDLLVRHASLRNHAGMVEQRIINAYYEGGDKSRWHEGDLVVHFAGCWVNKKCRDWFNIMWEKRALQLSG